MSYHSSVIEAFGTPDDKIVLEAHKRFHYCEEWEAQARTNFEYDYKFANGDSVNMYQWDDWVVGDRITTDRPCLTINKTMQHNLQIVNDGKQNKPGVKIAPVGDTASYEAAQIYMEICRHIEYISNAENVYDSAMDFAVNGGFGYWRIITKYMNDRSFDQDIIIKRVKDPRSVYLDPDIDEVDGSDANFGFIITNKPKDLYDAEHPDFTDVGGSNAFAGYTSSWMTREHIRVAEYYRKINKKDKYVKFILPETQEEIEGYLSELGVNAIRYFNEIKANEKQVPRHQRTYLERDVVRGDIEWYKIAGNTIIDRGEWLGKYIPIVRVIGRETVIDGVLDRVSHTRALLDPQRIYNVNSSANVEYGALQSKSPITAPMNAIEGFEEYYKTANSVNHSFLPYNNYDEDGHKLDRPERMAPPQPGLAYVQQMQIAQNEMMMVSGQYQAQMGENENAKSGVAINARQRQGDRATYHWIDGLSIATRFTGKILIDLIPKIYTSKRIIQIEAKDGSIINLTIDPEAKEAFQKLLPDSEQLTQSNENIINIIFNPNVGDYAVQADNGPNYATRRQEAFNALTQIAAQNKEFMGIAGDVLWRVADFPEAQILAQRWRRVIPPNITGDAPNPQLTEAMQQASAKIEQQLGIIAKQQQELADRSKEFDIKERELALKEKTAGHDAVVEAVREIREDFKAITDRLTALGNAGPIITPEQIKPLINQAVEEALANGQSFGEIASENVGNSAELSADLNEPPVEDAMKAPDGNWYVPNPEGGHLMVENG
jgi:hypothetical protein